MTTVLLPISVIIVNYNAGSLLLDCIRSVIDQADEVIGKATPEIFLSPDELQAHREAFTAQLGRDVKGPEVLLEFAR